MRILETKIEPVFAGFAQARRFAGFEQVRGFLLVKRLRYVMPSPISKKACPWRVVGPRLVVVRRAKVGGWRGGGSVCGGRRAALPPPAVVALQSELAARRMVGVSVVAGRVMNVLPS